MFSNKYVKFRTIKKKDLNNLIELRNDISTWTMLKNIELLDICKQEDWYKSLKNEKTKKYYIYLDNQNNFLGLIRMDEIDLINRSIRVGCNILKSKRSLGFGSKGYDLILDYCFNFMNMNRVWLEVIKYNKFAIKLYQNKGFLIEGVYRQNIFRNGKYYDSLLLGLLKKEYIKNYK